jgi:phospholipid transport system substrate-binding protein
MFRTLRRSVFSLLLATSAVAFVGAATVAHAESAPTATDFMKTKHAAVTKLLKTPKNDDRDKKVDGELKALVDYEEMAKSAVGTNWDGRSDVEKKEFTDLLKQLVEKNYKKQLDKTVDYDVTYKGEEPQGSDFLVKTEAKNPKDLREVPVTIDYLLRKKGSSFIVVDIIPEGSSTVRTYNKEITKIVKKDGWQAVVNKMKDKLAKG